LPEAAWLSARSDVRVVLRSNSMPALVAAAIGGHGIIPLPVGWGDAEPGLERVLVLDAIAKRKIWLVGHGGAHKRPAVRIVADHVTAIFASLR
jgi:DNA-binding transcriptional LysR family regulator